MRYDACSCVAARRLARRDLLKLAGLGGAAALGFAPRRAAAAGDVDALLLSCIDYRLTDKTANYMAGRGLKEDYDQVVLAGASLGAVTEKFPDWGRTFWEHLDLAVKLHGIKRVIALDHRDCGAYRLILGKELADDRAKETRVHAEILHRLRSEIRTRHPALAAELLLMALDGSVETIA